MEPASSEEGEPASDDFDVASEAFAAELGTTATPGFKRALKEVVMACMATDYGAEEEPTPEESDLALVFSKPKKR